MATRHQKKNTCRQLWHEKEWTVVTDPPHDCMTLMLFATEAEAKEFLKKVQYSYILPPSPNRKIK